MDKSVKDLCSSCNKKKDCVSLCPEASEYLGTEETKASFSVGVAESFHKKRSGAYQEQKTIAGMQIDGANKDDVEKLNKLYIKKVFKDIPQQYLKYFYDFLGCTNMKKIAKLSGCSKQNIQKMFALKIGQIAELAGRDNKKIKTPHQFKMKFALTDVIL
jgi:hypothetical protein